MTHARALDLPPPFRLIALREAGDAFAHACAHAAELGAGSLVFVGRFDLAEFAVVLEPEEPLAKARQAFYAGMEAVSAALSALAPPEKPIAVGWPDAIYVDGGLVGGGRLGWPERTHENAPPTWLVFGACIRTVSLNPSDAGPHLLATTLEEEGFREVSAERLVEGFARYLMVMLDRREEAGFAPIAADYASRLRPEGGLRGDIDQDGDFRLRRGSKLVEHRPLVAGLEAPSWLDPSTGGPRL